MSSHPMKNTASSQTMSSSGATQRSRSASRSQLKRSSWENLSDSIRGRFGLPKKKRTVPLETYMTALQQYQEVLQDLDDAKYNQEYQRVVTYIKEEQAKSIDLRANDCEKVREHVYWWLADIRAKHPEEYDRLLNEGVYKDWIPVLGYDRGVCGWGKLPDPVPEVPRKSGGVEWEIIEEQRRLRNSKNMRRLRSSGSLDQLVF